MIRRGFVDLQERLARQNHLMQFAFHHLRQLASLTSVESNFVRDFKDVVNPLLHELWVMMNNLHVNHIPLRRKLLPLLLSFDVLLTTCVLLDRCHAHRVEETDSFRHLVVGLQIILVDLVIVESKRFFCILLGVG